MPNPGDVPIFVGPEWSSGPVPSSGGVVVKTFLASQANAIAALQGGGFLPATGTVAVTVEGFGGGGGGGGSGGTAGAPGAGGGGARYQRATVLIDLTHQIDVVIGAGGVGGTAGTTTASGLPGNDGGASYANDVTAGNTVLAAFGGASGGHGSGNAAGGLTQPGGDHPSLTVVTDTNQVDANATTSSNLNPKTVGVTGAGGSGLSSSQGFRSQPNSVQIDSTVANPILTGAPGGTFVIGASGGGGGNGPRGVGATGAPGQDVANSNGNPGGNAAANTGAGGGGGSPGAAGAGTPTGGPGGNGGTGWLRFTFHLNTTVAP